MLALGFIWAVTAPLFLLAPIFALRALLRRAGWPRPLLVAAALVLVPVGGIHALDRAAFNEVCRELGRPEVFRKAEAEEIYLNSGTANSFGTRYLHTEGFSRVERRDIHNHAGFVRVAKDASGLISDEKIDRITARYEVEEVFAVREGGIGVTRVTVKDRQNGDVMAKAADASFQGGRMSWVLGAYGATSCLTAYSDPEGFMGFYHLARNTLRPAEKQPAQKP